MNEPKMTLKLEEQADLARLMSSSAYTVLVKLWEDELRQLEIQAIYTSSEDATDNILANRSRMAKAAAAYYTKVRHRIEREAQMPQLEMVAEPFEDITAEILSFTGE